MRDKAPIARPPCAPACAVRKALLLALLLALLHALPLAAQPGSRLFDETAGAVRRRFHDKGRTGPDWERLVEAARPRARACATPDELRELINRELLAPLRASHTVLLAPDVYRDHTESEFQGRPSLRAGLELGRFPEGYFVTAVHDGGPAARAAIELGERLLAVNGLPPEASIRVADAGSDPGLTGTPRFLLRVDEDRPIELLLQEAPGGAPRTVRLWADALSLADAVQASARVVARDGKRLGILHLWHVMHPDAVRAMQDALDGPLAEADGLVLDLRGRGGQVASMWGALRPFLPRPDGTRGWSKPAVALIDGSARSAKEILAWHWRRAGVGPLVGQRTAGAVLGATFIKLSDGSALQLAVADVASLTGGVSLESVGVEPDLPVTGTIPWCRGRDAILEKGLEALADEIRKGAGGERAY
jgi:carboxyl-terminal processing protease